MTFFSLGLGIGPVVYGMGLGGVERYSVVSLVASMWSVTIDSNYSQDVTMKSNYSQDVGMKSPIIVKMCIGSYLKWPKPDWFLGREYLLRSRHENQFSSSPRLIPASLWRSTKPSDQNLADVSLVSPSLGDFVPTYWAKSSQRMVPKSIASLVKML